MQQHDCLLANNHLRYSRNETSIVIFLHKIYIRVLIERPGGYRIIRLCSPAQRWMLDATLRDGLKILQDIDAHWKLSPGVKQNDRRSPSTLPLSEIQFSEDFGCLQIDRTDGAPHWLWSSVSVASSKRIFDVTTEKNGTRSRQSMVVPLYLRMFISRALK